MTSGGVEITQIILKIEEVELDVEAIKSEVHAIIGEIEALELDVGAIKSKAHRIIGEGVSHVNRTKKRRKSIDMGGKKEEEMNKKKNKGWEQ